MNDKINKTNNNNKKIWKNSIQQQLKHKNQSIQTEFNLIFNRFSRHFSHAIFVLCLFLLSLFNFRSFFKSLTNKILSKNTTWMHNANRHACCYILHFELYTKTINRIIETTFQCIPKSKCGQFFVSRVGKHFQKMQTGKQKCPHNNPASQFETIQIKLKLHTG